MSKRFYLINLQKINVNGTWSHVSKVRPVAADNEEDLKQKCRTEYKAIEKKSPDHRVRAREIEVVKEFNFQ